MKSMAAEANRVLELSNAVKTLLAGRGGDMQGAVLANLVALWLAGHAPAVREAVLESWLETTKRLVDPNEQEIFRHRARPAGWHAN